MIVALFPVASIAAGESIGGKLIQTIGEEKTPAEGVTVVVLLDGVEVGTGDRCGGAWEIAVPGPALEARLDTSSLPDGVGLTDPDKEVSPISMSARGRRRR